MSWLKRYHLLQKSPFCTVCFVWLCVCVSCPVPCALCAEYVCARVRVCVCPGRCGRVSLVATLQQKAQPDRFNCHRRSARADGTRHSVRDRHVPRRRRGNSIVLCCRLDARPPASPLLLCWLDRVFPRGVNISTRLVVQLGPWWPTDVATQCLNRAALPALFHRVGHTPPGWTGSASTGSIWNAKPSFGQADFAWGGLFASWALHARIWPNLGIVGVGRPGIARCSTPGAAFWILLSALLSALEIAD